MSATDFNRKKLSDPVPFSRSPFWKFLDQYYDQQGPAAWDKKIPHYVTNNPALASAYAQVLSGYYLDCRAKLGDVDKPLYIIELGAGSGLFSYYLLKALKESAAALGLSKSAFRVIITDRVERNIKAIEEHPSFQPFFKKGLADTVLFDCLSDEIMLCRQSQKRLLPEDFVMMPVIVGHYLLDSLPIDVFQAKKGMPHAVHVGLSRNKISEYDKKDIRSLNFDQKILKINDTYYKDTVQNELLFESAKAVGEGFFHFPVSAFKLIDQMKKLVGGQFIFSCMDKGFVEWACYKGSGFPSIFYHDNAFSFDLNFAALNSWVLKDPPSALFMAANRNTLKWAVYQIGAELPTTGHMVNSYNQVVRSQTPIDYGVLYQSALACNFQWPLSSLLSLLSISRWDPVLLIKMSKPLTKAIASAYYDDQSYLVNGIKQSKQHWIKLAGSGDFHLAVGQLMHAMGLHEEAIESLKDSIRVFGERYNNLFELGRAYFSAGDSASATTAFTRAQKFKITKQLTDWIQYFKKDKPEKVKKKKKNKKKKKEDESEEE